MNSYIVSIRPKWVKRIIDRGKTFEVRKSAPKEVPFKAYIYVTKDGINGRSSEVLLLNKHTGEVGFGDYRNACHCGKDDFEICNGHIIGEFICDKAERFSVGSLRSDDIEKLACLSYNDIINYFYKPEELDGKTAKQGFAWHISELKIYDKPKELSEFGRKCDYASEIHCRDCLILGDWNSCCGVMCKSITRPPQSYMRVEELGE